jgi:hypothetical protein
MMLFGRACDHMANVSTIYFMIQDKVTLYERMTKNHVAHLLWAIFTDARGYFSTPHDIMGNPPTSDLEWLIGGMRGGNLPSAIGTPLESLFGNSTRSGNPYQIAGGSGGNEGAGRSRSQQGVLPPNPNVHSKLEAATAAARRCNPDVEYRLVMATAPNPKPRITTMPLSRGGCFNYLFFGQCREPNCSFKHDGVLDESKIDGAIAKMVPGLAKFVELN